MALNKELTLKKQMLLIKADIQRHDLINQITQVKTQLTLSNLLSVAFQQSALKIRALSWTALPSLMLTRPGLLLSMISAMQLVNRSKGSKLIRWCGLGFAAYRVYRQLVRSVK